MLSREVALNFLEKTLHLEKVEEKLNGDKLSFLNEIIAAQHQYIPYQNFKVIGTEVERRCNPSLEDCINENLNKFGGVCVTNQGFFVTLLQCLGYNAHIVGGNVPFSTIHHDHLVIIVTDVQQPGDKYYIDVGFSYPTLFAIPLHHLKEGESDTYQFCFLTIRIEKEGQSYVRSHKKTSKEGEENENWMKFLYFEPEMPKDFNYFDKPMTAIFTDESQSIFLKNCFATRYTSDKAITVKNFTMKIWYKEDKRVEQINFNSAEEASAKIAELFPMLPFQMIRKGYKAWEEWNKINSPEAEEDPFGITNY